MTDAHVGLVGPDADGAAAVVGNAGGHAHVGTAADVLAERVDAVAALSESALYDLVRAGLPTDTPVLAVNAGDGVPSVPATDRDRALRRLVRGEYSTRERQTLAVDARREEYRALADVALVTAEAARISEYAIDATGETGEVHVDTVRADGVVVATPAGTRGYVRTDDAPVLSPTVEAVAVVPIAPFRVECPDWVVSLPATLSVERDETKVALLVDDEDVGLVEPGAPVAISYGDPVTLAVTDEQD
ncbi:ATP-NAD kinase [Halarchaeum sp. P4]|uniref:ATP-NAD kinase n=1 Tax=Halarchaeum sp. P4 TaxID=3421639 RepID=UPI003EB959C8